MVFIVLVAHLDYYQKYKDTVLKARAKDTSRMEYDKLFKAHVLKVQDRLGAKNVCMSGDFNVAPTEKHIDRRRTSWRMPASTKAFERHAHHALIREAQLKDAASI